jgi:hypothetical protein
MKIKILSTVFFMLMAFMYEAQGGSLQFNQVLTYNGTLVITAGWTSVLSPTYTCPAGKVWKIESKTRAPQTLNNGNVSFFLNSTSLQDLYGTPNSIISDPSPLWLKAGDDIYFKLQYSGTGTASTMTYYLSIIEYNIVP